jgi:hypothetical protein
VSAKTWILRAAAAADACSSIWPLKAVAETTFPFSSTSTRTVTWPEACAALAMAGYAGCTSRIAFPFSTPPEIVFGGGGGTLAAEF